MKGAYGKRRPQRRRGRETSRKPWTRATGTCPLDGATLNLRASRGGRRSNYVRHLLCVHPELSPRERSLVADRMAATEVIEA